MLCNADTTLPMQIQGQKGFLDLETVGQDNGVCFNNATRFRAHPLSDDFLNRIVVDKLHIVAAKTL